MKRTLNIGRIVVRLLLVLSILTGAHLGARWIDDDYDGEQRCFNELVTRDGLSEFREVLCLPGQGHRQEMQEAEGFLEYDAWSPFAFAGYHLGGLGLALVALGIIALGGLASMSLFTWVFMGRLPLVVTETFRECENDRCACVRHRRNRRTTSASSTIFTWQLMVAIWAAWTILFALNSR